MIGAGDAAVIADVRLEDFLGKAGIVVIASHAMQILRQWCNRGMLLQRGWLIAYGPIEEVIARYNGTAPNG